MNVGGAWSTCTVCGTNNFLKSNAVMPVIQNRKKQMKNKVDKKRKNIFFITRHNRYSGSRIFFLLLHVEILFIGGTKKGLLP